MSRSLKQAIKQVLPPELMTIVRRIRGVSSATTPAITWHDHMASLVKRDLLPKAPINEGVGARTALFWTPMASWPHMLIEYFVAWSLRLRGWNVLMAVCDGRLPHCEMERANFKRPSCGNCWRSSQSVLAAMSLPFCRLSDFVSSEEVETVISQVENLGYDQLTGMQEGGYEVGIFSKQYLVTYFQGLATEVGPAELAVLRRITAGNLLAFRYAERVAQQHQPEIVMMLNGNVCQTQPAYVAFRRAGMRVITWDDYGVFKDAFTFSNDEPAVFSAIAPDLWAQIKATPLTEQQEQQVDAYLDQWAKGGVIDINYHPSPVAAQQEIGSRLELDPTKRLFAAFTNIVWDSAALGRDIGFRDMMHWVYALCDWFSRHQEAQLAIRVHPAERRLPKEYATATGVAQLVKKRYPDGLLPNIKLIDADDDIYSYTLADMADGIGVYTSSLGYELAVRGRCVWVAGQVHYRDKGFVLPIENEAHLYALLEKPEWDQSLSPEQVTLARRYAYFRFFRQVVRVPFLEREETRYVGRPYFKDLRFLYPGRDPLFSTLVDRIISGSPIVDIPWQTTAQWENKLT